jgi:cell division septation protein DedD
MRPVVVWLVVFALGAVPRARAQSTAAGRSTNGDSVFARARQLVQNGNGAAGRVLIDSVVAATEQDTPAYAEALYWRATLAAESTDAERDYRRIVVEYPLSPRTGDALLQLAQLESARGDRAAAAAHLERFVLENPKSVDEQRASVLLVRLSFEQNDLPHGCIALRRTLNEVPSTSVELRNQLEYYSPRCVGVDTAHVAVVAVAPPAAGTAVAPVAPGAKRDTTHRDSVQAPRPARGRFTLQVAAYTSRADADRLAKKLKARKLDVRVAGTSKLFRVRIGHYETRSAAAAAAKLLKAQNILAFVTEVGAEDP